MIRFRQPSRTRPTRNSLSASRSQVFPGPFGYSIREPFGLPVHNPLGRPIAAPVASSSTQQKRCSTAVPQPLRPTKYMAADERKRP